MPRIRAEVDKHISIINRFHGTNLSLSSYRPDRTRLYQIWQNEGMPGATPLHRHHESIKFVQAFLDGFEAGIEHKKA